MEIKPYLDHKKNAFKIKLPFNKYKIQEYFLHKIQIKLKKY